VKLSSDTNRELAAQSDDFKAQSELTDMIREVDDGFKARGDDIIGAVDMGDNF
jgi:hypothetical protein